MEGSRTRWFHSFPAVGHRSAQDWLVAAFQPAGQLRRFVGCFSLIASFRETYQRPFSSSKQHIRSLKIFPGSVGCSSSVRDHWGIETQMRKGQGREAGGCRGSQPYRAAALPPAFAGGFPHGTPLRKTPGYLDSRMHLQWGHGSCRESRSRRAHSCQKKMHLEALLFLFLFFTRRLKKN